MSLSQSNYFYVIYVYFCTKTRNYADKDWTTDLVVILHELDDHPDVVTVVLDGDDPHDVGSVLRVRVSAVLEEDVNIT